MNFEFSADQMQLKDIARKFLEKENAVKRQEMFSKVKNHLTKIYGSK